MSLQTEIESNKEWIRHKMGVLKVKEMGIKKQEVMPQEMLDTLVNLKIAMVKDGKYVYSSEFEKTVSLLKEHPPSRLEQISIGNKVARSFYVDPFIKRFMPRNKHDVGNLVVAYVCLTRHLKRINEEVLEALLPTLAYSVWYLNDHEVKEG